MTEPPRSVDEVIARAPASFRPEAAQGLTAVFQYCVTGEGGKDYYCDVDDGTLRVCEGRHASPSLTITLEHQDLLKMSDPTAAQVLFMQGKLKVEPTDLNLIMKVADLFGAG
jgi:hypothetical protein